jgi:hypothetical protein
VYGKLTSAVGPLASAGTGTMLGLTAIQVVLVAITILTVCIVLAQAVRPRKAVR